MATPLDSLRSAMARPRASTRPPCMACGRAMGSREDLMRLRGGVVVHRACATYRMRRRRVGADRLGYPHR